MGALLLYPTRNALFSISNLPINRARSRSLLMFENIQLFKFHLVSNLIGRRIPVYYTVVMCLINMRVYSIIYWNPILGSTRKSYLTRAKLLVLTNQYSGLAQNIMMNFKDLHHLPGSRISDGRGYINCTRHLKGKIKWSGTLMFKRLSLITSLSFLVSRCGTL